MLELLKIKKDINWLIDQVKCLVRKKDLDCPLSATEWSANHSTITGNPYIVDCFVWFEGKVYKSLINNNIYPPTNATYWANLGLGHLLLEEQTDWNATTGRALLKNKPNLSQYALDSNVVHKTGNETIAGRKTFTDNITLLGDSKIISATSADNETGFANIGIDETGMPYFQLGTSANENTAVIRADNINTNSTYQLPNGNGTIALDENLVHKTGNEIINGIKDFTNHIIISAIYSNSGQLILASGGTNIIISDDSEQIIANREFIAPSLRIPGGTSTQFLKADGSIDNTIYAENANVIHTTGDETKNGTLIVNDTGNGFAIKGNSTSGFGLVGNSINSIGVVGQSSSSVGVVGNSASNIAVLGQSTSGTGVEGNSQTGLGGSFSTNTGTKIVSFLTNNVEQAYILASGLFKANRILINTDIDNGIDALQVDGSVRTTSDIKVNGISVGRGGSISSVLMGNGALQNNTSGNSNVAIGSQALFTTTNASLLVAIGQGALFANTSGSAGVAVGAQSLNSNTTGNNNTAVGRESLKANTIGFNNTAVGRSALLLNVSGNNNTVFGTLALQDNISGNGNVAIGSNALSTTTGNNNIGIGLNALQNNTSGGGNIGIGQGTSTPGTTNTNSIVIGNAAVGLGSNTTVIGNSSTTATAIYGDLLLGTTVDNGTDKLQVNGSISASAATTANQVVIKSQLDLKANDANVLHKTGNETKTGTLRVQNTANTGYSIEGIATGTGIGVYAESIEEDSELPAGIAVYGVSPSGIGVKGYSEGLNNGVGVFAESYATALQAISYEGTAASFNSYQGIGLEIYGNGTVAIDCNLGNSNKGLVVNSGVSSTGNPIEVNKNGVLKFRVAQNGDVTSTQYKLSSLNTAPATSTSTGTLGEIRITATHIYVCIATNTWVRTALTSW